MDVVALTFASGWASGINAYATVFLLGMIGRFGPIGLAAARGSLHRVECALGLVHHRVRPFHHGLEALAGAGNAIEVLAMETVVQQRVQQGMIGRVYGFISSLTWLGLGVSTGLGGLVVDATSPRFAFLIGSIGGVLTVVAVAPTLLRAPAPTAPRST